MEGGGGGWRKESDYKGIIMINVVVSFTTCVEVMRKCIMSVVWDSAMKVLLPLAIYIY